MLRDLVCPISNEKIDSNVSRLTILISVVLVSVFIITKNAAFLYLAMFDYFVRAFTSGQFSPLRWIASIVSNLLKWSPKWIDKAPKVFASRLGFICLLTSAILNMLGLSTSAIIIAAFASVLFLLDALGIVCVGCIIYHYVVFPFFKNNNNC